jgi:hypothetical protein
MPRSAKCKRQPPRPRASAARELAGNRLLATRPAHAPVTHGTRKLLILRAQVGAPNGGNGARAGRAGNSRRFGRATKRRMQRPAAASPAQRWEPALYVIPAKSARHPGERRDPAPPSSPRRPRSSPPVIPAKSARHPGERRDPVLPLIYEDMNKNRITTHAAVEQHPGPRRNDSVFSVALSL